jgi:hypothetical protein
MRLAALLLATWALAGAPLPAHADPTEIDPDLAAADQDYAAARKAIVAEQWDEAIAAYLMVGDVPNAEKHLAALRAICLLPCEELADLEKAFAKHRR